MEWNDFVKYALYFALVAGGIRVVFYFIKSFKNEKPEDVKKDSVKNERIYRYAKSPKIIYYIVCGIYVVLTGICIVLLLDEASHISGLFPIFAILGNIATLAGCILLFARKYIGIVLTITGSVLCVLFSFLSGTFSRNDYFHADEFMLFLVFTIVPSLLLLPQVIIIVKVN